MRRIAILLFALPLVGCNALVGIDGYRTGDPDASDGAVAEGGPSDAGASDGDAQVGDEGPPLPCADPLVSFRITVVSSATGEFTGITDTNGLFAFVGVGQSFASCVQIGRQLDLQAVPDNSDAKHDWGVPACGIDRRCQTMIEGPTDIFVHLQ